MRVISYGGGVQSTALVIMAATRNPEFEALMGGQVTEALMANVGDDSEHPATLEFVRQTVKPWAATHGVNVHELDRVRRDGTKETLWEVLHREESRSIGIPVRMENGAPGTRQCTSVFKIKVIGKWLKANGASKTDRATVGLGISTDEIERINRKRSEPYENPVYPLIDMGWDRSRCQQLVVDTLGVAAPKSACFFCPFHRPQTWAEMRRDEPDLFEKSVQLERTLNERRTKLGKDNVYLTRFGKPLDVAVGEAQTPLFFDGGHESCDEGHCWT